MNFEKEMKVQIIGCGLIGTSIALRLKERGHLVWLADEKPENLALARALIGNAKHEPDFFDLIIIATPISAITSILASLKRFNSDSTVIDIGGLKSKLILQVEEFKDIEEIFVSAHPMAGRESSGPQNARADLFEGRAWLVTPTRKTNSSSIKKAENLGELLGSSSYLISANDHDEVIAAVSHMPQLISSLMGSLIYLENETSLNFAGQGLRDVSRLADSNPQMWTELILENRDELLTRLNNAIDLLKKLQEDLSTSNKEEILEFFENGRIGRSRIPGKHGSKSRAYAFLPIVIDDKPGQLAKIFDECAAIAVNIEDLTIEHSPNQEKGLVTLALSQSEAPKLKEHLKNRGWQAQEIHN